tara:strand:+ start:773 stop:1015 length:243 start_codon:yes stop_codon:yes gene_type:complete
MGAVCSIINRDFVFVPERDIDNTRTVMTKDGQVRVYSRSRRGTRSQPAPVLTASNESSKASQQQPLPRPVGSRGLYESIQ